MYYGAMDRRQEMQEMIERGFTTRQIAERLSLGHFTARYWLKKYGLRTKHEARGPNSKRHTVCIVCHKKMADNPRNLSKCGSCMTAIRRYLTKQKAIAFLGGKCKRCGYSAHPAALEFHHRSGKDFAIGQVANKSWSVIVKELKKCDLLCSNCHRIEHSKRTAEFIVIAAKHYNGKFIGQLDEMEESAV